MADTIVTNTPGVTRNVDDGSSALGWVVALLVVLALIVAGIALYRHSGGSIAPSSGGANINVSLPSTGGTGAGAGSTGGTGATQ